MPKIGPGEEPHVMCKVCGKVPLAKKGEVKKFIDGVFALCKQCHTFGIPQWVDPLQTSRETNNVKGLRCAECGYTPEMGDLLETLDGTVWCKCPNCDKYKINVGSPGAVPTEVTHPLLNPESKHYSMIDNVEAITRMEQMYTTEELMVWTKITAMKYRLRICNKDDVAKEGKKIETHEAYYRYLKEQLK